jgi:hypothetical protein
MEGAIRAAIEYLGTTKRAGASAALLTSMTSDQVLNLQSMFARMHCDMADATRAMALLADDASFSADQRSDIVDTIHVAVRNTSAHANHEDKTQTNMFIYNYVPESVWLVLLDKHKSADDRINAWIDLLLMIGMRFPDVPTKKLIVATTIVANGDQMTHVGAHDMFKKLRDLTVKRRVTRKDQALTMRVFPEDVTDFVSIHLHCYQQCAPPVACRVDVQLIKDTVSMVAARSNNILVAGSRTRGGVAPSTMQLMNPAACIPNMLQIMVAAMAGGAGFGPGHDIAPINMMTSRGVDGTASAGSTTQQRQQHSPHTPPPKSPASPPGDRQGADEMKALTDKPSDGNHAPDQTTEDDIDKMLGDTVLAAHTKAKAAAKATAKATAKAKAKAKTKAKGKPKTLATPKATATRKRASPTVATSPPKFGTALPLSYRGCNIYHSASTKRYRVVPKPGKSVYDKAFSYKPETQNTVWKSVVKFCEKPTIPKDSCNYA